jgi:large subunit ribosomal protein L15
MKLNELRNRPGSTHPRKVLGRGIGSGLGKTSGRGVKGQKARTGVAVSGFEGGQMPLYRRMPKRGFTSYDSSQYVPVNVGRLQSAIDAGRLDPKDKVTIDSLVKAGVVRRSLDGMRLLGDGELKAKLTIEAVYASESARAAVEKAGGSVTMTRAAPVAEDKKVRKLPKRADANPKAKKGDKSARAKKAAASAKAGKPSKAKK